MRLCQEHGLYGALVYLFNKGLDDFRTPLEELLAVLHKSQREAAAALGYGSLFLSNSKLLNLSGFLVVYSSGRFCYITSL